MTFPFLALAACSDTTLVPVDAVPSQIATGSTSLAVGTCEHISVEPAATGARSVCPTAESTWDMEVELEIADEMAAFTSPIVLGGTLYALTGRDELLRVTAGVADLLPLPEGTAGGLTSLGGAHVDGQDLLTFALSVDGSTEVSVARYAPSTGELLRSDTLPALDVGQEIVFSDLDRDGELDLVSPGGFVSLDLSSIVEFDHTVNSGASVYIDELDGEPRVMQSEGLWNADGTQAQLWSDGLDFQGAIVEHLGRLLAIYTQWIDWFARWADTGEELWRIGPGVYEGSYRAAYGDADGDGVMDVCLLVEDAPVVMNADGDVIASWPAHEHWTLAHARWLTWTATARTK